MKLNVCIPGLRLAFVTFGLATFLVFTVHSARAVSVSYTLTLTETSPALLTYTYTNPTDPTPFTVTPTNTNVWHITIDPMSGIVLGPNLILDFAEAAGEPSNEVNRIVGGSTFPFNNTFTVNSDLPLGTGLTVTNPQIGTDNGAPIFLQFVDSAAAAEAPSNGVPETGSTLALLALSSGSLVGLTRLRRLRAS